MPSTYAHYRFGKEVLAALPEENAAVVKAYPQLYAIGLHGPDIFFYYGALYRNPVNALGHGLHRLSGREIFSDMARIAGNNRAGRAYLYGFLCHFALDSVCHGYVNATVTETGHSHNAIESAFERMLMQQDGLNPLSQVLTRHIHPSLVNASVISRFFDTVSAHQVERALQEMLRCHALLRTPTTAKRKALLGGLRLIGQYDSLSGLLIPETDDPSFTKSNERLFVLYRQALPLAIRLIGGVFAGGLDDPAFDLNFESELPENVKNAQEK